MTLIIEISIESLYKHVVSSPKLFVLQAKTKLGVSLEDIELNDANMSEVLRLFIIARNDDVDHEVNNLIDFLSCKLFDNFFNPLPSYSIVI